MSEPQHLTMLALENTGLMRTIDRIVSQRDVPLLSRPRDAVIFSCGCSLDFLPFMISAGRIDLRTYGPIPVSGGFPSPEHGREFLRNNTLKLGLGCIVLCGVDSGKVDSISRGFPVPIIDTRLAEAISKRDTSMLLRVCSAMLFLAVQSVQ